KPVGEQNDSGQEKRTELDVDLALFSLGDAQGADTIRQDVKLRAEPGGPAGASPPARRGAARERAQSTTPPLRGRVSRLPAESGTRRPPDSRRSRKRPLRCPQLPISVPRSAARPSATRRALPQRSARAGPAG